MGPMRYSGVQGKLILENNLKSEILCQTPFSPISSLPIVLPILYPSLRPLFIRFLSPANNFSIYVLPKIDLAKPRSPYSPIIIFNFEL